MNVELLSKELELILLVLKVPFSKSIISKRIAECFICEQFGLVATVSTKEELDYTKHVLLTKRPGYRYYVLSEDVADLEQARYDLIWLLAEGGYFRYLRATYHRQFMAIISTQDFGHRIIDERLARWNNLPKYKYFIEENERAKNLSYTMLLSVDPGFFDYMPTKSEG